MTLPYAPVFRVLLLTLVTAGAGAQPAPPASTAPADPEARFLRNIRQVTRAEQGLARSGEGYFSPDGKTIVFQSYPPGKEEYQIFSLSLDEPAARPRLLSTGEGATTCAYFHPDGKRILFASNHLDQRPPQPPPDLKPGVGSRYQWPFQPGMDLFERDLITNALRRLTDAEGYDAEGSYSPDGTKIVFTSMRDGDQEIYICDADGTSPRRITNARGYDGGPFFSPDGKRIVYRSDRRNAGDGSMQIFVNNLEGTAERALTDHSTLHWCPFWHPSGRWLVYTRGDHPPDGPPTYDLYLLSDDGKRTERITTHRGFDGLPVFSPDGKRLLWTAKRDGLEAPQLFVADFLGTP